MLQPAWSTLEDGMVATDLTQVIKPFAVAGSTCSESRADCTSLSRSVQPLEHHKENDMKRYALSLIGLAVLIPIWAKAGGALNGTTIVTVIVDFNGLGIVTFSQPIVGSPPSCVIPAYAAAMAFDTNTQGGRTMLAVLMSAKASGSTVDVGGRGACTVYPGQLEDLYFAIGH
jgi:hypothetical protein